MSKLGEILIISGGAQASVQDLGRTGYQQMGMPTAGVMDSYAARCANILAGNDESAALIESALLGPEIQFLSGMLVAVTGADMQAKINGVKIRSWKSYLVSAGDILKLNVADSGMRSYIAFSGGINAPLIMGSRSTYIKGGVGGFGGRALKSGDILNILSNASQNIKEMDAQDIPFYGEDISVRVILGPHKEFFTGEGIALFLSQKYTIGARSDRMGIFLEGKPIGLKNATADILSCAILMGSIQITNDAAPVVMMADGQTTGGYAQIAAVVTPDLWKLAQAKPGSKVRFMAVSINEASKIYKDYDDKIAKVKEKSGEGTSVKPSRFRFMMLDGKKYDIVIEEVI